MPSFSRLYLTALANRQVTFSSANEARSESAVAVNPMTPSNMICASKKFYNPALYMSTIGISYSIDGGTTWQEVPLPPFPGHPEFTWLVDPDVVYDAEGTAAYLWAEPIALAPGSQPGPGETMNCLAMVAYRSPDGGATWLGEAVVHSDISDDKGWIAADDWQQTSPHAGTLYAFWGADTPLRFARSGDDAVTWQGVGASPAGSDVMVAGSNGLDGETYAPATAVGPDGTIHVAWNFPDTSNIVYTRSLDGGQSFDPFKAVATDAESLTAGLMEIDGFPTFPGANFRVLTMVTIAADASGQVVLAWPDFRDGVARIYMVSSPDGGASWPSGGASSPLLPDFPPGPLQHFHPQLAVAGNGVIGCAFYEYGQKGPGAPRIDVRIAGTLPGGDQFSDPVTVTDKPWDPTVKPPFSHGDPNLTFIGDYFGLAGGPDFFTTVWTDTRTGQQELFSAKVQVQVLQLPSGLSPEAVAQVIYGVIQDGGGAVFVGGHVIHIPPWDPGIDVLNSLGALSFANEIRGPEGAAARAALWRAIGSIAAGREQERPAGARSTRKKRR
ncbi:MAG TPA: sialidase family protein [Alphaproteobacteria bacterium]|nr:sialidase family protein [Alphaproteobacteria bacterium]